MQALTPVSLKQDSDLCRILVADDQQDVTLALSLLLKDEGFDVHCVDSPAAVLKALRASTFDIALIDLNYSRDTTSGKEGLVLLDQIHEQDPALRVVVMTAWGSVELAVSALRRGAADFVEKPWDNSRLLSILRSQRELRSVLQEQRRSRAAGHRQVEDAVDQLVSRAPAMLRVIDAISRVAPADASVLITGENGTGKTQIARQIHLLSSRNMGPFVQVNMGGLASGVFESEMFGHVKGAFTDARGERVGRIEMAHGGTLFLDEIANMPMDQQVKLLHVIETGQFEPVGASRSRVSDIRLITATNADLKKAVANGTFRKDLYFRLNTVELKLPTLVERGEDIESLALYFLSRHGAHYKRPELQLADEAKQALFEYTWPGNIRELNHVIERAVLLAGSPVIGVADLRLEDSGEVADDSEQPTTLEEVEKAFIESTIRKHRGSVVQAAKALGLSRSAMYRRMEKHGIGQKC